MDPNNPRLVEVFLDVQRGLPRQGPGNKQSTIKALKLCAALPDNPNVLDIGCGPGMQTMALAEATAGRIIAVDTCDEYLEQLRQRVQQARLTDRVEAKHADMTALGLPDGSFDLIWCEGAAYVMGIPAALLAWRKLLRVGAYLAFTELIWLEENPPAPVANFFNDEYAAMTSRDAVAQQVRQGGYELVGDFTLPNDAWWNDYYTPLEAKLPSLKQKYGGDEEALSVVAMAETEIEMRRRFGGSYAYHFFVARNSS